MSPVRLGARWSPAAHSRRPYMGQAVPVAPDILTVVVRKGNSPEQGVSVEVMFQNGDSKTFTTDAGGTVVVPYTTAQRGQTVVRITSPSGVEDLGENSAQGIELNGGAAEAAFALVGTGGSPLVGLGIAGAIYGLVLAVI